MYQTFMDCMKIHRPIADEIVKARNAKKRTVLTFVLDGKAKRETVREKEQGEMQAEKQSGKDMVRPQDSASDGEHEAVQICRVLSDQEQHMHRPRCPLEAEVGC